METDEEEIDEEIGTKSTKEINKDARNWAIACHLSSFVMFLGIPLGNIVGPLVIWLIKRTDYAFVNDQGKAVLNFQISMTLYMVFVVVLGFGIQKGGFSSNIVPMILILLALEIVNVAFVVKAAMMSNRGVFYRYPLTIEFLK